MADEIQITGQVNLVEVVGTLTHVVQELSRLGEVVAEEGRETRRRFDDVTKEVQQCRAELKSEIAALDKAQALTDKELRGFITKVSAGVSAATALILWVLKSGLIAGLL